MNTKHTPGPWEARKHLSEQMGLDYVWADSGLIANIFGEDRKNCNANAQLIAASPELLSACIRAKDYLHTKYPKEADIFNELQQAIAKATL